MGIEPTTSKTCKKLEFEPGTSDFNLFILTGISIYGEKLSKFAVYKT